MLLSELCLLVYIKEPLFCKPDSPWRDGLGHKQFSSYRPALINSTKRNHQLAETRSQPSAITFRNERGDSTYRKGVARQAYVCVGDCEMVHHAWLLDRYASMCFNNIPFHSYFTVSNWTACKQNDCLDVTLSQLRRLDDDRYFIFG